MIHPSIVPAWSRARANVLGRGAAIATALLTWGAAASAHAADLSSYMSGTLSLHASLSPLAVDAGAGISSTGLGSSLGAYASVGGEGGCGGFFGYGLSFDSMLFEVQSAPCGGFRAFDLAFLAVVAMIVIAALRFRHTTAQHRLELARRMVEQGYEPAPELLGRTNDLRRGLVLVATGIGLTLASLAGSGAAGVSPAGLIPGFIGLGYLVSHRFAIRTSGRTSGQTSGQTSAHTSGHDGRSS